MSDPDQSSTLACRRVKEMSITATEDHVVGVVKLGEFPQLGSAQLLSLIIPVILILKQIIRESTKRRCKMYCCRFLITIFHPYYTQHNISFAGDALILRK